MERGCATSTPRPTAASACASPRSRARSEPRSASTSGRASRDTTHRATDPGSADKLIRLGETDWTARTIVLDVDEAGSRIQYGIGIAGPGKAWIDEPNIETVGTDVALTSAYPGERTVDDWLMTGVGAPDYTLARDGNAVRIESTKQSVRYVALLHVVPATSFVGKKAHATLEVRADGIQGQVMCIMKVQRVRDLQYGGFLAFDMKPNPGTTSGFVKCDLGADVSDGAKWILYGASYKGDGKAWVRAGSIH